MSCAAQSGSGDASCLFVVNAAEATLTGDTLALSEVSPQVVAFRTGQTVSLAASPWKTWRRLGLKGATPSQAFHPAPFSMAPTRMRMEQKRQCSIEVELMAVPVFVDPI